MAFDVTTYTSEEELGAALQAEVQTYASEEALEIGINASVNPFEIVAKGGYFTLISDPLIANISLRILGKGGFFTAILET